MGCEVYKRRLAYSVSYKEFRHKQLYKGFITKVLEYKAEELNLYAFLCVP